MPCYLFDILGLDKVPWRRWLQRTAVTLALSFAFSGSASALCRNYIAEGDGHALRYSYVCENTYAAPPYLIIRQFIGNDEQWFFEFAPKDVGLLCSGGSFGGYTFQDCHSYASGQIPNSYDGNIGIVRLYDLDQNTQSIVYLASAYDAPSLFSYPDIIDAVPTSGCAIVVAADKTMHMFYASSQLGDLSECLLRFETHATSRWSEFLP